MVENPITSLDRAERIGPSSMSRASIPVGATAVNKRLRRSGIRSTITRASVSTSPEMVWSGSPVPSAEVRLMDVNPPETVRYARLPRYVENVTGRVTSDTSE
jgi:hypothetical protein